MGKSLTLTVTSDQAAALAEDGTKSFTVHGGSIGRGVSNDWVLPDPERYLSGRHASIQFQKGSFFVIDTSTNGVYLNDARAPIGRGSFERLNNGDILRLGSYQLEVTITGAEEESPNKPVDQLSLEEKDEMISLSALLEDDLAHSTDTQTNIEDDVSRLRDTPGGLVTPRDQTSSGDWSMVHMAHTGERPSLEPPDPDFSVEMLPDTDIHARKLTARDMELEPEPEPESEPAHEPETEPEALVKEMVQEQAAADGKATGTAPAPPASLPKERAGSVDTGRSGLYPASDRGDPWIAFIQATGLDPTTIPPGQTARIMQAAGQLLREFVLGVMEVLQTRSELKNDFRVTQTTIQSGEYNPLKFAASVDEALKGLLLRGGDNYLPGVESVRQGFDDLKHHQQAILAAMHSAIESTLERFDPEQLREQFDRGLKRGPLMGATNKMKYWELYEELFTVLSQHGEGTFPHVFGDEFARAYEEEVERLEASGRRSPKAKSGS